MSDRHPIRRIFEDAVQLDPTERRSFLDKACGDGDTRAAVERLLAADCGVGPLDMGPTHKAVLEALKSELLIGNKSPDITATSSASSADSLVGKTIRQYRVARLIARGGMGEVYEAEQASPKRRVALKILQSANLTPETLSRFNYEADVLARLEHPNIARLYDAGTFDLDGGSTRWIAMELVDDGVAITDYAAQANLNHEDRLRLFAVVCDAIHYGHRKGFIHRDIKPSNILVGTDGTPRIIDFGVARAIDLDLSIATPHTIAGQLIGTLRYMSPEQCSGSGDAVDVRSDVYALGIVLYELLTGALPYDFGKTTSLLKVPRIICETLPRRPSAIAPHLRGDVETIILRCLEKEPDRRYDSPAAVARDIRHHLAMEPIEARSDRTMYVLRRVMHRHRSAVAAGIAGLLLITAALIVVSLLWQRAENQRVLADSRAEAMRRENYASTIALARAAYNEDNTTGMMALLNSCPADLRHWEWWHLHALADDAVAIHDTAALARPTVPRYTETILAESRRECGFAFNPNAGIAVIGGDDGRVHVWNLHDQNLIRTLEGLDHAIRYVCISDDGKRIAAREARPIYELSVFAVWNVADGRLLARGEARDLFGEIALSPDGRWCAVGTNANGVLIHDVENNRHRAIVAGHGTGATNTVAISRDGTLVAATAESMLGVWNVETLEPVWHETPPAHERGALAFSPDGAYLAIARHDGFIVLKSARDGHEVRAMHHRAGQPLAVAFSADSTRLAATYPASMNVWDLDTGRRAARFHAGASFHHGLAFSRTSDRLLAGCADGRIREFDVQGNSVVRQNFTGIGTIDAMAVVPGNKNFLFVGRDRKIRFGAAGDLAVLTAWPAHESAYRLYEMAVHPDGSMLASCGEDRMIRIWKLPDGQTLGALGPSSAPVIDVAWSADSEHIFGANRDGQIEVWDIRLGSRLESFQPGEGVAPNADWHSKRLPRVIATTPYSNIIATSGHEKTIRLWKWPGWQPAGELIGHSSLVRDIEFDSTGQLLVSGAMDGTVRIWEVQQRTPLHVCSAFDDVPVLSVSISPDNKRIAAANASAWIHIWDLETGRQLMALACEGEGLTNTVISGDGRYIIGADARGGLTVFDAPGFSIEPDASHASPAQP